MSKILIMFAVLCAGLSVLAGGSYGASSNDEHQDTRDSSAQSVNPVVQWNLNYAQIDLCGCVASFSCHGVCLSSRSMVPGGVLLMM
jgi:hypothetical protein